MNLSTSQPTIRMRHLLTSLVIMAAMLLPFLFLGQARALSLNWTGGGLTNNWSDCANWGGTCPGSGDTVTFSSGAGFSTKNSVVDASFAGTITTININSGYTGTISLSRSLTVSTTFSQAGGTFNAGSQTLSLAAFTLSAGNFTASSGTTSISGAMTISGTPTFSANGGTVNFNGTTTATLSCNSVTFNRVTFTHTVGTKTVNGNCSMPLGANPSVTGGLSVGGTLSGTGTLAGTTFSLNAGSFSGFTGFTSSGFVVLNTGSNFNFGSYTTFSVTGTFTMNTGSTITMPSGTASFTNNITINAGATFNANGGTVNFNGAGATLSCGSKTFNLVTFTNASGTKTVGSDCSFPLGNNPNANSGGSITDNGTLSGTGTLTTSGTFTLGSTGSLSGFSGLAASVLTISGTLNAGSYSTFTVSGAFTLSSGASFTAPSGTASFTNDFTLNSAATFTANGGTVNFNGGTATLSCGNKTFSLVTFTHTSGTKTVGSDCNLPLGANPNLTSGGSIANSGTLSGTGTLTSSNTLTLSSGGCTGNNGGGGSVYDSGNDGGNATGFGCGGGGASWFGGVGGNGLYGGGGGGAAGGHIAHNGGAGGQGVVAISPNSGSAVVKTSGSSWVVPAGVTSIKVWAIGAGGGGAGVPATDTTSGGGGGGGGVAYKTFSVSPGDTVNFSLGTAGSAGGASANGGNGGNTTATVGATTITGNGGAGGQYNNNTAASGGTYSGGDGGANGAAGSGATGDTGGGGGGAIGSTTSSASLAVDSISGNNGTPVNGANTVAGGILNRAGNFTSTEYLSIPNNEVNLTGDWSVDMWVKPSDTGGTNPRTFSLLDTTHSLNLQVGYLSPSMTPYVRINGASVAISTALTVGAWQHVVYTRSAGTITIYINGTAFSTSSSATPSADTTYSAINSGSGGSGGDGLLDEVVLYNRALTPTEVTGRFNGGSGTESLSGSGWNVSSAAVSQWHMNEAAWSLGGGTGGAPTEGGSSGDIGGLSEDVSGLFSVLTGQGYTITTGALSGFSGLAANILTINGIYNFGSFSTFTVSGAFTINSGASVTMPASGASSSGAFSLNSGASLTASSGTMSFSSTFTINSSATFFANGGTVNFNGITTAAISCGNVTFNLVTFTHTGGTKTVGSDCSLPLGSSPTINGGGGGSTQNNMDGSSATGFGSGGGGAGWFGGMGGDGLYGGGGGGAAGYNAANRIGGTGGDGVFVVSPSGASDEVLTSGSSWTVPVGVTSIKIWAIGAGGGGAGATGSDATSGGGGGGGGVVYQTFSVNPGDTVSFSLGAGGAGGVDAVNGSDGGDTTVTVNDTVLGETTITAYGGSGGQYNNGTTASGGSFLGGDGGVNGGGGSGATGNTGGGGGGGIGGGTPTEGGNAGDTGGQSADVSGLFAVLSGLSYATEGSGSGGGSGSGSTPAALTLNGTLSGSGTLTTTSGLTLTLGSGGALSGFGGLSAVTLTVSGGTYNFGSYNPFSVSGTFTLSSGASFTAPSGTASFSGDISLSSGATFTANGGTVNFNGTGSATLACGNRTFNLVTFTHSAGTKTVGSDCSLPLGANPTVGSGSSSLILNGTLSGSGTLTMGGTGSGTLTLGTTGALSGLGGLAAKNLTVNGTYNFGSYNPFTVSNTFIVNSGANFTAPTGTASFASTFTISSGATFSANGGTINFNGTASASLSCGNKTFSLVTFTHSLGTKTVGSDCSLPLGNNPNANSGGSITVNGALSGSGTLTTSGTLTLGSTGSMSGLGGLAANALTVNGTYNFGSYSPFTVSSTFILNSGAGFTAPAGTATFSSNFTISASATFAANGGTLNFNGSSATLACGGKTFNLITFTHGSGTKTVGSDCSLPLGSNPTIGSGSASLTLNGTLSGSGKLTANGTLTLNGTGVLSGFSGLLTSNVVTGGTYNFGTYSSFVINGTYNQTGGTVTAPNGADFNGSFTISGGTFNAPSGTATFAGNFSDSGTFNAGGGTVVLNGTGQVLSGNTTFYNLTKTVSSGSTLTFTAGSHTTVLGKLTLQGASLLNLLALASSASGSSWFIDVEGTTSVTYVDVSNSTNSGLAITACNSVDGGNNSGWLFNPSSCHPNDNGLASSTGITNYELLQAYLATKSSQQLAQNTQKHINLSGMSGLPGRGNDLPTKLYSFARHFPAGRGLVKAAVELLRAILAGLVFSVLIGIFISLQRRRHREKPQPSEGPPEIITPTQIHISLPGKNGGPIK